MPNIKKQAIKDADEFAKAKMFYGEGAGVRRRLIGQTVQFKVANVPGYDVAFRRELAKQDFAKLSRRARKERRLIDAKDAVAKNSRALIRGDVRSMSVPLLAVAAVGYVAHQTGYDKKALEYTQKKYRKGRAWVNMKQAQRKAEKEGERRENSGPTSNLSSPNFGATGP